MNHTFYQLDEQIDFRNLVMNGMNKANQFVKPIKPFLQPIAKAANPILKPITKPLANYMQNETIEKKEVSPNDSNIPDDIKKWMQAIDQQENSTVKESHYMYEENFYQIPMNESADVGHKPELLNEVDWASLARNMKDKVHNYVHKAYESDDENSMKHAIKYDKVANKVFDFGKRMAYNKGGLAGEEKWLQKYHQDPTYKSYIH